MGADDNDVGYTNDESDFFDQKPEENEYIPKKKGKVNNDPLAFLQRAQQEKQSNAQKQAMMEQEASAVWKKTEELNYNLKSEFMDHEDKWRRALGSDLYKQTNSNVDPSMRQKINRDTNEDLISREESLGIFQLLFKDGKGHLHDSWK